MASTASKACGPDRARAKAKSHHLPTVLTSSPNSSPSIARAGQSVLSIQLNRCHRAQLLKEQIQMRSGVHVHKYLMFTFIKPSLEYSFSCPGPRGERGQWATDREKVFISGEGSRLVEEGVVGLAFGNV